jgi:hypothetical protein
MFKNSKKKVVTEPDISCSSDGFTFFLNAYGNLSWCGNGSPKRQSVITTKTITSMSLNDELLPFTKFFFTDSIRKAYNVNISKARSSNFNFDKCAKGIKIKANIKAISCGKIFVYFSTTDDKGLKQEIGYRNPDTSSVCDGIKIKQICVGHGDHSLFMDYNNNIYGCGGNYAGQLGIKMTSQNAMIEKAQKITILDKKIKQLFAGYSYSMFLADKGEVYVCGSNIFGQLGIDVDGIATDVPIKLEFGQEKVKDISLGDYYSVFLLENNAVYSCGSNRYGQTGVNCKDGEIKKPRRVELPDDAKIFKIITKRDAAFFICDNGRIYGCGKNDKGQFGVGDMLNKYKPTLMFGGKDVLGVKAYLGRQKEVKKRLEFLMKEKSHSLSF